MNLKKNNRMKINMNKTEHTCIDEDQNDIQTGHDTFLNSQTWDYNT